MNAIHLVMNDFMHDSRVLREATAALERFDRVHVIAMHRDGLPLEEEKGGLSIHRVRIRSRPLPRAPVVQLVKYGEVFLRMLALGRSLRPRLVHIHDVAPLPIGSRIARSAGAPYIYDSHELWSATEGIERMPRWLQRARLSTERRYAAGAAAVITVSKGIAERLPPLLGVESVHVVRNVPQRPASAAIERPGPLRRHLGIDVDEPLILYQGGLTPRRGLEILVDAMEGIQGAALVFLGSGSLEQRLRERVREKGLEQRISFVPAVTPDVLPAWTRDATIGVHPLEATSLNHDLALPNKLFEYIQAGVPVVVSDLPEMGRLVREYRVGEVFTPGSVEELSAAITRLLHDPERLGSSSENAAAATLELSWDVEKRRLLDVYDEILAAS